MSPRHRTAYYRELTERERRSIVAAYDSEATLEQIAKRFTLSEARIGQVWTDAKLPPRVRGPAVEYGSERPRGAKR